VRTVGVRRSWLLFGAAALAACVTVPAASEAASDRAGWVITIASPRSTTPGFAYPFASGDELTSANVDDLQQLMYRPLYFFGGSSSVEMDASLSLATPPVYNATDTAVSFTIKPGRRWSDGEPVTAQGVVEWLNLLAAFPGMWGDYLAPLSSGEALGIPDDLREVTVSGSTVTLTLSAQVNPTWFTYNELSQITPLPGSWDRYEPSHPRVPLTGPSSITGSHGDFTGPTVDSGCYSTTWIGDGTTGPSTTFVDPLGTRTVVPAADIAEAMRCEDVVELYRSMAYDTADYTSPGTDVAATWGISDGPWRLATFHHAAGAYTMVPNRAVGASGQQATAAMLSFVPCSTTTSCEALLANRIVEQGTLPLGDAPTVRSLAAAPSHNPLHARGYREQVVAPWSTSYLPYNFASTSGARGHAGHVFSQLYFRQAFQSLVDQPTVIARDLNGYGVATTGPIPTTPTTAFGSAMSTHSPYATAHAAALLTRHGWHVAPGKLTTCAVPAKCGAGIPRGTPLSFTLEYAPSTVAPSRSVTLLAHDAAKVGIELTLTEVTTARVLADVSAPSSSWDLASWDGGWRYAPDYYPSGEWLFAAGSPWNVGSFNDPHTTALVTATLRSSTKLPSYGADVAAVLPVVWQPTPVTLLETSAPIHDVVASPLGAITPEAWRR
jgi:peptide/nickel transport system substrate-binding protein